MKKAKPFSITNLTKLSTMILQEQAAANLASGSYKLTQEIYKILLKREDKPRYRQGLGECYLQRALISAKQGKFKEAITLWQNFTEYTDTHTANDQYIRWLYKAGQKAKIKTYLQSLVTATLDKDYPQLALYLGFLHVGGQIDLLQWLPEESAFTLQSQHAQQAIVAFQNNDIDMQQHLAKIPFRSVYRDFRLLLKAASLLFESPDQASGLMDKIEQDSPYYKVGKLIAILPLTGRELTDALLTLTHKQQQFVCTAKDWTAQQTKLLQYISRQKQPLTDKIKFELAVQYQKLLGTDYAQRFCLALLPAYPAGKRAYEKNFGALDAFEKLRISALRVEAKRNYYDSIDYWEQCLELLHADKQQNALKIAFILRHIAKHCAPSEEINYQIESLEFDAEDKETHIKILSLYEKKGEKDKYKKKLQETLALFPKDIEFIGLAMQEAIAGNAYKKATQYADKILAIDPVNTHAKHVLFTSHLNHARKLLKTKKFHLVEKEIKQAEKLQLGKQYPGLAQLLYGFFVYVSEDKQAGLNLVKKSRKLLMEGSFINRYRVINEAMLLNIPLTPILREISPPGKDYVLSNIELNAWLKLLDEQHKEGNSVIFKALDKVKKDFKRLIKAQDFSQDQLLTIMQRLDRIKNFELMRHCLTCRTDKKFNPIWTFYKVYIDAKGNPANVPTFSISSLQLLYTTAKEQGDQRTAALISGFLDKIHHYHNDDLSIPFEDDYFDPYQQLFDHIDTRTFSKINRKFEQLQKSITEEKMIMSLFEMLPDKTQMFLLLKDIDLLDALIFLKAAQELDIDINVTVEEILAIAQENTAASSPFPFR